MPLKKKKYNARFPAGRIKKIMQSDEEVGKVAQAVPIIISRTLELFVESMLTKTLRITNARNAKTLSPSHMKQCIMSESRFDFLRELVKNIPDINVAEEQQGDNYPERRESSEDGMLSIEGPVAPNANGVINNPNGSALLKSNQHNDVNEPNSTVSGSSGTCSQWKYTKQNSLDSIPMMTKNSNNYSSISNDSNTPINYSIKIKLDDKAPPAKLLRMESTPASFGSNNNMASPIVTPNYVPLATTATKISADSDKQPIINFDFSKIPLLPSTASTSQIATTASNHSHSVINILKMSSENSTLTTDDAKNETHSHQTKLLTNVPRSNTNKPQLAKSLSYSPASSTITSNVQPLTTQSSSTSIQISSPMSVPLLSYNMPLSTVGTSSTLEMDEDYDNI